MPQPKLGAKLKKLPPWAWIGLAVGAYLIASKIGGKAEAVDTTDTGASDLLPPEPAYSYGGTGGAGYPSELAVTFPEVMPSLGIDYGEGLPPVQVDYGAGFPAAPTAPPGGGGGGGGGGGNNGNNGGGRRCPKGQHYSEGKGRCVKNVGGGQRGRRPSAAPGVVAHEGEAPAIVRPRPAPAPTAADARSTVATVMGTGRTPATTLLPSSSRHVSLRGRAARR